ncbi:MAG: cob(I)yrinic acid a,c-diamide adenosyltransferase [Duncaniella sp.]|nr:cob(I)yrinic acid a,c-diamide adenosyltransferase [Duncaniella sp.]
MKKSMIYTRTGDNGTTALVGGTRIAKNSPRVTAYGSVDELNAHIGLLQAYVRDIEAAAEDSRLLLRVNAVMFSLGAYLATPSPELGPDEPLPADLKEPAVTEADIEALEHAIDRLDASVPPQRTFILPGGTVAAGVAHVARTVCRRAEREVLDLADTGAYVHPMVLRYINRLSDYLFILARGLNHYSGVPDIPWP